MDAQPHRLARASRRPRAVLPLPALALLLSGCPSTVASADAAQETPLADTAPADTAPADTAPPVDRLMLDAGDDAPVDRPLTCDVPRRTEVGVVGVVCSGRPIDTHVNERLPVARWGRPTLSSARMRNPPGVCDRRGFGSPRARSWAERVGVVVDERGAGRSGAGGGRARRRPAGRGLPAGYASARWRA